METILKRQKKRIKDHSKLTLSTLVILFFIGNYHICNFFYPLNDAESVKLWWYLKTDIYVLIICLCYITLTLKSSSIKRIKFIEDFIISFGVGFAVSNVIDRWFLESYVFSWHAYYPLVLIAIVSYFNVKRLNKIAEKHASQ